MNIQRLLNSPMGRLIISVLLGLGLATLFQRTCVDGSCLRFNGPVISEVDGQTYQFGEFCYKYDMVPTKCDNKRKSVEFDDTPQKAESQSWVPFSAT